VYLGLPSTAGEPPKRLVGFRKIWLDRGEQIKVTVVIDPNASDRPLSYWEASVRDWAIANGTHKVYLGGSAGDIAATATFTSSAQRPRSRALERREAELDRNQRDDPTVRRSIATVSMSGTLQQKLLRL
jgi:hypothetical protein